MDFTREPVIETVITPKEGCKLVVRSSKSSGQEEYFVDAVEVVSFGHSLFFRSLERPKAFIVPVSDYEILEVREARMVLKNVGVDRSIKIGGGRETAPKLPKEPPVERERIAAPPLHAEEMSAAEGDEAPALPSEARLDKKRGRRHYRRRRGRDELPAKEASETPATDELLKIEPQEELKVERLEEGAAEATTSLILSSILPPPPTLISETIARYKDNAMFKGAFFVREGKEEAQVGQEVVEEGEKEAKEPYEAWISDEAEEEIFRHRASTQPPEEITHESSETPKEGNVPNN